MIDIERKHFSICIEKGPQHGGLFIGVSFLDKFEFGLESEFDWEDETQGPYRFYVQKLINKGWGPVRYFKVPFSKARKWTPGAGAGWS